MAVQVHVAFSSIVNGSGVFAGGPYHCAEGNLVEAMDECMIHMSTIYIYITHNLIFMINI